MEQAHLVADFISLGRAYYIDTERPWSFWSSSLFVSPLYSETLLFPGHLLWPSVIIGMA